MRGTAPIVFGVKKRQRKRRRSDRTPALVLLPAALAPLVLVGGWNLASGAQPDGYSNVEQSLSSLASSGAPHREIMTWALVLLGLAHLGTAALLRAVAPLGRAVHALGGLATIGVALLPLGPEADGTGHAIVATVAFVALAVWPAVGGRTGGPPVVRPRVMRTAAVVLSLLVIAFGVALVADELVGLTERIAATAEALWPLVVAWMVREWSGGGGSPPVEEPPELPEPDDEKPSGLRRRDRRRRRRRAGLPARPRRPRALDVAVTASEPPPDGQASIQETYYPELNCFGCGHANADGLRLRSYERDGLVRASFLPWPQHDNGGGYLNGGILSTLLDCHGAAAVMLEASRRGWEPAPGALLPFVTAELDVKFRRPAPLHEPLELTAELSAVAEAEMTVVATAIWQDKTRAIGTAVWKRWRPR